MTNTTNKIQNINAAASYVIIGDVHCKINQYNKILKKCGNAQVYRYI